jgi:hypothetical protein
MHRALGALTVGALVVGVAGAIRASADTQPTTVSVHVQRKLDTRENVHIGFHSVGGLPTGGYYYAVIVLKPYKGYTRRAPPPCSTSSDMQRTDYGYPQPDGAVALALTPSASRTGHWCGGGSYAGAVYAVPHAPPCESKYPCRTSEPYERSPCWELQSGHEVCGVVAPPRRYVYPEGVPEPLAQGARIVGRFSVVFPQPPGRVVGDSVIGRQERPDQAYLLLERQGLPKFLARCVKSRKQRARWQLGGRYGSDAWPSRAYGLAAPGVGSGRRRGVDPPERACSESTGQALSLAPLGRK